MATDDKGRRIPTVDSGVAGDVFPGALVVWLHTPRGGYGYTFPIDAKVISHGRRPSERVTIEVAKRDGTPSLRVVLVKNLRWRS